MELLRVMGVDAAEDGVRVTVAAGAPDQSGAATVDSRAGGSISAACLTLRGEGDKDLFFGHVSQLLVGEDLARQGLEEVLGYVERDVEMRLDTALYVVRGTTAETALTGAGDGAADRLEAISSNAGLGSVSLGRSVKDILEDWERSGAALVPALTAAPDSEGGRTLTSDGYAVLKSGVLVGWVEGPAAAGVGLLLGQTNADILKVETNWGSTALRLVGCKTTVRPVFRGDALTGLEVRCTAEANVAEAPAGLDPEETETMERLRTALEATCVARIRAALDCAQALNADFLSMGAEAALTAPWHKAALAALWPERFASLPLYIEAEGKIQRGYDVK